MDANEMKNIPQEKFELVERDETIFDTKFETKPIGYFKDAWLRFSKNKASIVAFVILGLMVLFAIFVPIASRYDMAYNDPYYSKVLPKLSFMEGTEIWDGTETIEVTQTQLENYQMQEGYVVKIKSQFETYVNGRIVTKYRILVDSYEVGYQYVFLSSSQMNEIFRYEQENNIEFGDSTKIMYPAVDYPEIYTDALKMNGNYYYEIDSNSRVVRDENGDPILCYLTDENGNYIYGEEQGENTYKCRVLYREYYKYRHGGQEACHIFGASSTGQDILVRLATGARLSLVLGVVVASINIAIGICYGAIEGYYGGVTDLVMERISEILAEIPFTIVAVLFNLYLAEKVGVLPTLVFAFILTGWLGTAARVRMQFYRYKGQEYVLAARTLGAKDGRLIFRHILPNAIGTIVTSCILMIPSVIFTESSLTYLGIIDLSNSNITSVGTLLADGQGNLSTHPHIILFPALFISILMISFNQFGKGLRDAFNPSLRGVDE